jgi:hypothetical protein
MVPITTHYEIDGVQVTLVRDERGAHWSCSQCQGRCQHVMKAVAWLTLHAWDETEPSMLH